MPGHKTVRCAIYTRKSSEEGLELDFNSLDAQREACAAYIVSQKHEGWSELPARYDDGGFSGGNLQRPGLERLLTDIKARRVDVIVVYKVDRLTRSLTDFAKIVEVLDAHNVSEFWGFAGPFSARNRKYLFFDRSFRIDAGIALSCKDNYGFVMTPFGTRGRSRRFLYALPFSSFPVPKVRR
jgi:hypothetical protein